MTYDIYISGPMTGRAHWNHPVFHQAAVQLRSFNLVAFNPAETFGSDTTLPREVYMRVDIEALLQSRMIVMLDGWSSSQGAVLERTIARELGIPCLTIREALDTLKHNKALPFREELAGP